MPSVRKTHVLAPLGVIVVGKVVPSTLAYAKKKLSLKASCSGARCLSSGAAEVAVVEQVYPMTQQWFKT
ncbi:hypothetical protein L484_005248 [Morus notabilis]|uniref:Uncharacterized protein n=1 Tax=Morus notabilis TaxID=981085 RepID=W9S2W4_9ROSA|nr:hypothetical protein L484_005248 [Morus notabilis]